MNETRKNFGQLRTGDTFRFPESDTVYRATYVRYDSPRTTVEFNTVDNTVPSGMSRTLVNLSTVYVIGN